MSIALSILVPMYNEEEMIPLFFERVDPYIKATGLSCEYIVVNDGSKDATLAKLKALAATRTDIKVASLSRNFGKEAALTAGLELADGQAIIIMDADLQDPADLIPTLVSKWQEGYENVYAQRIDRSSDTFLKRLSAQWFYKVYNAMAQAEIPYNVGDCRLLSRRAAQAVLQLPDRQRFMKGLFSWIGFKSIGVPCQRAARVAGSTKWNYWKLWNFAIDGLTASTAVPLKLWTYLGGLVALFAFVFALWTAFKKIMWGNPVGGYASLMVAILFFSGVQLITLGIIGEYLGRIFTQVKGRPSYFIDEKINF